MNTYDIDFTDGHTEAEKTLDAAISVAQNYIAGHPTHTATFPGMTHQVRTRATIYESDKAVATVSAETVQTLDTDPGF